MWIVADQLGEIVFGGNLMAFDMMAALSANNSDTLEVIEKEFRFAQSHVKSNLDLLPKTTAMNTLREAASKLLALGDGRTGVFKTRMRFPPR